MSQLINFGPTGGGGGGAVDFLTGNVGGPVGPTGNNIFVLGNSTIETVGNPGASTITIYDNSKIVEQVTTVDATPTSLVDYPVPLNGSITLSLLLTASDNTQSQGVAGTLVAGARRAGAGPTLIGVPTVSLSQDFGTPVNVNAVISGNNLEIQVIGVAATTITWKGLISIISLP
jgi:hypothetical protein